MGSFFSNNVPFAAYIAFIVCISYRMYSVVPSKTFVLHSLIASIIHITAKMLFYTLLDFIRSSFPLVEYASNSDTAG